MPSVRVQGTEQLSRVAKLLTEKGNSASLKRRIGKGIKKAAEPITKEQRASLAAGLPKRGGAAETISSQALLTTRTSLSGSTVTITDSWRGHNLVEIDRGSLRHPLFGDRNHWYTTNVPPGLLRQPVMRNRDTIALAIIYELAKLAEEIAREA